VVKRVVGYCGRSTPRQAIKSQGRVGIRIEKWDREDGNLTGAARFCHRKASGDTERKGSTREMPLAQLSA
jgi:hypothetical protein